MEINLKKKEFLHLLLSLAQINDSCILSLREDGIHAIVSSEDNAMYAYGYVSGCYGEQILNIPSLKKLSKAFDMITSDDVVLKLNGNHLEYKDKQLKFKYHLHEDGIITKPKISLEKLRNFEYNIEFDLNFDFLSNILQKSSIINTKKLYIFTENDCLVWKIGDETVPNSDSLSIMGDEVDFELQSFILKIDNLKLLSKVSKHNNLFKINSKIGVGCIITKNGDFKMEYIFTSLKN
jgi:hypothetical protein